MTTASPIRAPLSRRDLRSGVAQSVASAPLFGVVRTESTDEAFRQARAFREGGVELIEITFTVPGALEVVRSLVAERAGEGPPWLGMGTVTNADRARQALAAGAEFLITPNVAPEVAEVAREAGVFLVIGALTPSEIVTAAGLGADLVKAYPLPPVGGAAYLATIRQPLPDIPILAAGGFGPGEIPAYRDAGAVAFGLGAQLLGSDADSTRLRIADAIKAARS